MLSKSLLVPERKRILKPPFAWIDRRFLFGGFLAELSPPENLLYFFLVLAADRDGLSFYSYDKICQLLSFDVDVYLEARNGLMAKGLMAFDGQLFQVLVLPKMVPPRPMPPPVTGVNLPPEAQSLAQIFAQLGQSTSRYQESTSPSLRLGETQNSSTKILAKHS
jgi:hypothetical protein